MKWNELRVLLKGRQMPLAFLELDALENNIAAIVERARGHPVRIATKSIRCVSILRRLLDSHPTFRGLMAYSGEEALCLLQAGFEDILIGYPVVNQNTLRSIAAATKQGKVIVLMADSKTHLSLLDRIAEEEGVTLRVCLDMDLSRDFGGLHFGVYRSPLRTAEEVVAMAALARNCGHLTLEGIMGYEAQLSGVPDRAPGGGIKNMIIRRFKGKSEADIRCKWAAIGKGIPDFGSLRIVNGGGTGSIEFTRSLPELTELTIGSAFYAPSLFDHYDDFHHEPAAGFALEITRIPARGIYTCSGGGYVASGPVSAGKLPLPWLPEGMKLMTHEGAGEVQTPVNYSGTENLAIGDPLIFRHAKAGEICERFNTLLLIRKGKVEGEVKTYRGEGWSFM
jgi:D-serine deaminase-like pyridoxal phosphate-dependent protein